MKYRVGHWWPYSFWVGAGSRLDYNLVRTLVCPVFRIYSSRTFSWEPGVFNTTTTTTQWALKSQEYRKFPSHFQNFQVSFSTSHTTQLKNRSDILGETSLVIEAPQILSFVVSNLWDSKWSTCFSVLYLWPSVWTPPSFSILCFFFNSANAWGKGGKAIVCELTSQQLSLFQILSPTPVLIASAALQRF